VPPAECRRRRRLDGGRIGGAGVVEDSATARGTGGVDPSKTDCFGALWRKVGAEPDEPGETPALAGPVVAVSPSLGSSNESTDSGPGALPPL